MGEVEGQQKAKYKDEVLYLHDLEGKKNTAARQIYLLYNSVAMRGVTVGRCFVLHAQVGLKHQCSLSTQLH